MSRNSLLKPGVIFEVQRESNHNHLVRKRTFNHLAEMENKKIHIKVVKVDNLMPTLMRLKCPTVFTKEWLIVYIYLYISMQF